MSRWENGWMRSRKKSKSFFVDKGSRIQGVEGSREKLKKVYSYAEKL